MPAKYFSIIQNYVLSVSSQRKYNLYHHTMLLNAFQRNSHNSIGRDPSMVIPLLAKQDLVIMLVCMASLLSLNDHISYHFDTIQLKLSCMPKVGVHLIKRTDHRYMAFSTSVCQRVYFRPYPCHHTDRKANSTLEIFWPKYMECTYIYRQDSFM